ncbi:hypothetical protein A2U01_0093138, partial [Trifolium medium]|nr:hypothetical protein [Trifolium medium]
MKTIMPASPRCEIHGTQWSDALASAKASGHRTGTQWSDALASAKASG